MTAEFHVNDLTLAIRMESGQNFEPEVNLEVLTPLLNFVKHS